MTPQQIAEKSTAIMWAKDDASQGMGMDILSVGPGTATLRMIVEQRHTNGHDICHGGFIFALADSAFAFACNSYNTLAVAQHNTISFIQPGKLGDCLMAKALEVSRAGRNGVYDVTITNQHTDMIALFRGCSRIVRGTHF